MKLEIVTRNCDAGDHLKEITQMKLAKLDKYFGDESESAKVYFKKEKDTLTTEVMLSYANKLVRASASGANFYENLDIVLPKLEGQIRKHRTRFDKDRKNSAFKLEAEYDIGGKYENNKSDIVKEKKFNMKPMTIDEAVEEMELLGHSFFVFKEIKTDTIKVLYKRNDGDLGLIEPM